MGKTTDVDSRKTSANSERAASSRRWPGKFIEKLGHEQPPPASLNLREQLQLLGSKHTSSGAEARRPSRAPVYTGAA